MPPPHELHEEAGKVTTSIDTRKIAMTELSKLLFGCRLKLFGTISVLTIIALPSLVMSVQAAQLTLTHSVSQRRQAAALAHWTRARIAGAPAMALQVDQSTGAIDSAALFEPEVIGPGESSPAGTAARGAAQIAQAVYAEDWIAEEAAAEDEAMVEAFDDLAGTFGVYTFYDVNVRSALQRIYPHRWDGKLTFNTPSGGASCSATVISGNNIVTAAHCVYDTSANRFYSNWVFTPAFRNGNAPFGTFAATACTVLTAWVNLTGSFSINTWSRHDVAMCTLGRNSANQTINQAVGFAGRLWNASNQQLVFNSGYPAQTYTDDFISNGPAQYLRACTAETFLQTTETLGSGCFWGRGISGGSWLVGYKPFIVNGYVNSVNSGLFIGQQNLYGARFNSNNIVPLCSARNC
jgi:V8-like Glu-specific endopeptidase